MMEFLMEAFCCISQTEGRNYVSFLMIYYVWAVKYSFVLRTIPTNLRGITKFWSCFWSQWFSTALLLKFQGIHSQNRKCGIVIDRLLVVSKCSSTINMTFFSRKKWTFGQSAQFIYLHIMDILINMSSDYFFGLNKTRSNSKLSPTI